MSFIALTPDLEQFLLDSDRRFQRITTGLAIPTLIFMLSVPFIKITTELIDGAGNPEGERIARLLQEIEKPAQLADKVEEPKPAEKDSPKPPEKAGPAPKKSPVKQPPPSQKNQDVVQAPSAEQQVASARQAAARSGVMAFADQLADLRSSVPSSLDSGQPLQSGVISSTVGGSGPSDGGGAIAAAAGRGSGGIGDGTGAVTTSQSGTGLGTRRTTTVAQPKGFGKGRAPGEGGGGGAGVAGRTLEDIQLTFDRNKGSFYIIFNRALRDDASLGAGKIVVNLTIAPDGSVTNCTLAASSFNNPELERKVIQRVMLLNFGAKNVPTITFPGYPINFLPS